MVDIAALRALISVRDHGSIVAAAEALDFTPSAVSQQIKKLERTSRVPMLERVGRTVILTERGRLLAERGQVLLADLEQVESLAAGGTEDLRGSLRLASFSTATAGIVAPLVARLRSTAPDLEVVVIESDPRETVSVIQRGGADLGIVHDWTGLQLDVPGSLERRPLMDDVADVLLHRDHPLAGRDSVSASELLADRWITTLAGTICHEWLMHMFALHGERPDTRYFDGAYGTHVAMVDRGAAVALVPRLGRPVLPESVVAVPVTDPSPRRSVSAVWRASTAENPARRHVEQQLLHVVS
ncbi:LysR family transcriptional regulator [Aeromicrobium sp. CF3.5]|uniref:LysR family transcriptional regulator n=1 Tax=Aeromicrobium sp. CF3.5 TaxID=3373078 RepID=UPI003EE661F6